MDSQEAHTAQTLVVIWTADDPEVARKMVFMYTRNSRLRDWWPRVRLIVWGPSARLLSEDAGLQEELEDLKAAGVELLACKACADLYGVSDKLSALGLEVVYVGQLVTEHLKMGHKVLTV